MRALLLALIALLATSGAAQAWELPAQTVSDPTIPFSLYPAAAMTPDGTPVVAWWGVVGMGMSVVTVATQDAPGTWSASPIQATSVMPTGPLSVVAEPDGAITAVWASGGSTWSATRPAGSDTFDAAARISDPSTTVASDQQPHVAASPDGSITALWVEVRAGSQVLVAAQRPSGGVFGAADDVSGAFLAVYQPRLAAGADGTVAAAWYRSGPGGGGDYVVEAAVRAAGATAFGDPEVLSVHGNEQHPRLAVGPDGAVSVIWVHLTRAHGLYSGDLMLSRRPSGAARFPAPASSLALADDARESWNSDALDIVVTGDGATTVGWIDSAQRAIQTRTDALGSGAFAPARTLVSTETGAYGSLALSGDRHGTVHAAWAAFDDPTSVIEAAARAPLADDFDAPVAISDATAVVTDTAIATGAGGETVAAWDGVIGGAYFTAAAVDGAPTLDLRPLTVQLSGQGSVRSMPLGIACSLTCSADFVAGRTITLTATPAPGAMLIGWDGACSGATPTCVVAMTSAQTVRARFGSTNTFSIAARSRTGATFRLTVPGPGVVRQRGVLADARGRASAPACASMLRVTRAGAVTIRCRLAPATRRLLERRAVRLAITTSFTPRGGVAASQTTIVTIPRRSPPQPRPEPVAG